MESARTLVEREVARQLIRAYGVTKFDLWLGKDGLEQRSVGHVARVVVDTVWPLIESNDALALVERLHLEGTLAPPPNHDPHDW